MKPSDLASTEPKFDLFAYFAGQTRAWGIFQTFGGQLKRQFTVDILGEIDNNQLTLTEDFVYADGEVSQRIWHITRQGEHHFTGKAADIVGEATGESYGCGLNWRYTMALPFKGKTLNVQFDDWLFLQPDGVLLNRAKVKKLGLQVGEVTLAFNRLNNE